jgi:hypothetical protein
MGWPRVRAYSTSPTLPVAAAEWRPRLGTRKRKNGMRCGRAWTSNGYLHSVVTLYLASAAALWVRRGTGMVVGTREM